MSIKKEADVSRRKRRGIKRILAMLVLRLAIILAVGSAIFFLAAKIIIDDEIDFSGNFSVSGLADSIKTLIITDGAEGELQIVLDGIKRTDSEGRIEKALILDKKFKILAAKLKGSSSDDLSHEKKLVGKAYTDTKRLAGLTKGVREFEESGDTITIAAPVIFGEKVQGYVLFTLNHDASKKARNWLVLGLLATFAAMAITLYRMRKVLSVLTQFTNVMAAEQVLSGELSEEPEEIRAVIGQIDIKEYTAKTIKHTPKEMVAMLNNLFSLIGWVMADYGATIDKIVGDAILWLIKVSDKMNIKMCAEISVEISVCIQYVISAANFAITHYHSGTPLLVRIGLATDKCVQGTIGPPGHRRDFTIIGQVVNLAARVEAACKVAGLLITGYLWGDVGGEEFLKGEKNEVDAKGFENPVTVHNITGLTDPEVRKRIVSYILAFFRRAEVKKVLGLNQEDYEDFLGHLDVWLGEQEKLPLPAPEMKAA